MFSAAPAAEPHRPAAPSATVPAPPATSSVGPAWLGFFLGDAPDGGVQVVAVVDGGPAATAGLRQGDVLFSVNERPVPDRRSFREVVGGLRPGETVVLEMFRDGKVLNREIRAEPRVIRFRVSSAGSGVSGPAGIQEGMSGDFLGSAGEAGESGATLASIPPELRRFYAVPADAGVLVTELAEDSVASAAGLKVGDVLVRAGGEPMRGPDDLDARLARGTVGGALALDVVRGGKPLALSIADSRRMIEKSRRASRIERIEEEMARLAARMDELGRELERLRERPRGAPGG
jgi:serine protease Do